MMEFRINIDPMGAVRMTGRGKFVNPYAKRYLSYKDFIKWSIKQQLDSDWEPTQKAVAVKVWFYMPVPKSWSKRKKNMVGSIRHIKKPDIDNLIKGLFDALNGLVWNDDNQVVECQAVKAYGDIPGIEFKVEEKE